MSGAPSQDQPAAVKIDRLVLDIPGLHPAQAEVLAKRIGEGLARAGLSGAHASIGITLGPLGIGRDDLAARIVAALLERLV
jgi:hypothetical protein